MGLWMLTPMARNLRRLQRLRPHLQDERLAYEAPAAAGDVGWSLMISLSRLLGICIVLGITHVLSSRHGDVRTSARPFYIIPLHSEEDRPRKRAITMAPTLLWTH